MSEIDPGKSTSSGGGLPSLGESASTILAQEKRMPKCDGCGNEYDKSFQVTASDKTYVFDSFECAIQMLAPVCAHCRVRIIGHGLEKNGVMFCCSHCAEEEGVTELRDRS